MARVGKHWVAVDQELPPDYPLVLLSGVAGGGFDELAGRLPGLGEAVRAAELDLKLARAGYERRKRAVHQWVRDINGWMRAYYRGTPWFALVRRVPGLGQSYQHWWEAAQEALGMWRRIVADPPAPLPGPWVWPLTCGDGKDGGAVRGGGEGVCGGVVGAFCASGGIENGARRIVADAGGGGGVVDGLRARRARAAGAAGGAGAIHSAAVAEAPFEGGKRVNPVMEFNPISEME